MEILSKLIALLMNLWAQIVHSYRSMTAMRDIDEEEALTDRESLKNRKYMDIGKQSKNELYDDDEEDSDSDDEDEYSGNFKPEQIRESLKKQLDLDKKEKDDEILENIEQKNEESDSTKIDLLDAPYDQQSLKNIGDDKIDQENPLQEYKPIKIV